MCLCVCTTHFSLFCKSGYFHDITDKKAICLIRRRTHTHIHPRIHMYVYAYLRPFLPFPLRLFMHETFICTQMYSMRMCVCSYYSLIYVCRVVCVRHVSNENLASFFAFSTKLASNIYFSCRLSISEMSRFPSAVLPLRFNLFFLSIQMSSFLFFFFFGSPIPVCRAEGCCRS